MRYRWPSWPRSDANHLSDERGGGSHPSCSARPPFAYLAMTEAEGPYVLPLNFAYEDGAALGPTALTAAGDRTPAAAGPRARRDASTSTPARPQDGRAGRGPAGLRGGHRRSGVQPGRQPLRGRVRLPLAAGVGPGAAARGRRGARSGAARHRGQVRPGRGRMPFGEKDFAQTLVYAVAIETVSYKQRRPHAARQQRR